MQGLTEKELSAIEDQMTKEQNIISKYRTYADSCTDTQLKARYEDFIVRHQKHFDALYGVLLG